MINEDITIVYIAGASRSGSTFFEDYLARYVGGFGCGEIYRIAAFFKEDYSAFVVPDVRLECACGEKVRECPFWRSISDSSGIKWDSDSVRSQLGFIQRALFRASVIVGGPFLTRNLSKVIPSFRREINVGENCFRIYAAISAKTGSSIILDSSKQAHQYYILKAVSPGALKVIALVRDGRAVAESMTRGPRAATFAARLTRKRVRGSHYPTSEDVVGEAMRAWFFSTLKALVAYLATRRENRLLLRYEDFCAAPESQLNRVVSTFELSVPQSDRKLDESHAIGGSPSRHEIGFDKVKMVEQGRRGRVYRVKGFYYVLGRFLNMSLGYR